MIRLIAAIDLLRGIGTDAGQPWDLPSYEEYKNKKISSLGIVADPDQFDELIEKAGELYLTQICGDFECTRFFPHFEDSFRMIKKSPIRKENGVEFQHQVWRRINKPAIYQE